MIKSKMLFYIRKYVLFFEKKEHLQATIPFQEVYNK